MNANVGNDSVACPCGAGTASIHNTESGVAANASMRELSKLRISALNVL